MTIIEKVKEKLQAELDPVHMECEDFSDDACSGAKLELTVVSDKFTGKPPLARHRMVNSTLASYMEEIHALTIKAWTPAQDEAKKGSS